MINRGRIRKMLGSRMYMVFFFFMAAYIIYTLGANDDVYNSYKCQTKELAIKGIINEVDGRSGYMVARVNNIDKMIYLNVKSIKYRIGYSESHGYSVGDSIIKLPKSKEVTIKSGDSICVFILDCAD